MDIKVGEGSDFINGAGATIKFTGGMALRLLQAGNLAAKYRNSKCLLEFTLVLPSFTLHSGFTLAYSCLLVTLAHSW